jgi:AICAR transformylase/IMP cyclohydrolase PurH
VWDKTGLVEFATGLHANGVELVASGGTAKALATPRFLTSMSRTSPDSPRCSVGRVKTLHPRLHAGILADRSKAEHLEALRRARHHRNRSRRLQPLSLLLGSFGRTHRHRRPEHGARRREES